MPSLINGLHPLFLDTTDLITKLINFYVFIHSETTMALARNLSPALIRFQGLSTPSFMFSLSGPKEDRLAVTPPMWIGLNKWIRETGLTPVFALSDIDRINDQWDARMVLPLMELSDRMGLECYWEIDNCEYLIELTILGTTSLTLPY